MRFLVVFGTRPEAIKMAPIVAAFSRLPEHEVRVCVTGQHRTMLDEVLRVFSLKPDYDLDLMQPGQSLTDITTGVLVGLGRVIDDFKPDWVLVQGDTTTAMATALAAFYRRVAIAHVEAGLRTGQIYNPWPEEANRKLVGALASRHYPPTERARGNLLAENVAADTILVTGNPVIDALLDIAGRFDRDEGLAGRMAEAFSWLPDERRMILVTGHRRESFGTGFRDICTALSRLADRGDLEIVYPVHLNPNVRGPVFELLANRGNVHLIEPLDYVSFVYLMRRAHLILTDSGGVQEEAPSLGKPVLVMRETSERLEAVEAGTARLVTTDPARIEAEATRLLDDAAAYSAMSRASNPFGDGQAARRIVEDLVATQLNADMNA